MGSDNYQALTNKLAQLEITIILSTSIFVENLTPTLNPFGLREWALRLLRALRSKHNSISSQIQQCLKPAQRKLRYYFLGLTVVYSRNSPLSDPRRIAPFVHINIR